MAFEEDLKGRWIKKSKAQEDYYQIRTKKWHDQYFRDEIEIKMLFKRIIIRVRKRMVYLFNNTAEQV